MMRYFVDKSGRYLGGWDLKSSPPVDAKEVPDAPEDARMLWGFPGWRDTWGIERERFKSARDARVAAIKVVVDGMEFDGDERSQERMARTLAGMFENDEITWILADNSRVSVTKTQLREALRLAVLSQASIWTGAVVGGEEE